MRLRVSHQLNDFPQNCKVRESCRYHLKIKNQTVDFYEQKRGKSFFFVIFSPYLLECFAYASNIERTIQKNRLLCNSNEHWNVFGHFQWHFMPWTIVNRMGNVLKAIGYSIANFTNVIKSDNPSVHANHGPEHIELIASINVLVREKENEIC